MFEAITSFVAGLLLACSVTFVCYAGERTPWDDVPKAVQETILANGGVAGQQVDKESGKKDGKTVFEAPTKDNRGNVQDLVITEDGKLVEVKTDDAGDRTKEQADFMQNKLAGRKFSHPRAITNSYVPLASLKQDILEGKEGNAKVRVERTAKPNSHKTFKIGEQTVEALVVEDRAYEDGKLVEVAIDYFAQDDDGTVYYLGEEVDEYSDGNVVGHAGSWMTGKDTPAPGVLFPAQPKVGDRFKSENVSKEISEDDEVVSISETVTTPAGTYNHCVKIKEQLSDGGTEYKYYAPGVGVVREAPSDGDVLLISHESTSTQ
jgi:hypothetical protein